MRRLTTVGILATLGTLVGCGAEEPGTMGDTSYEDSERQPASESTQPTQTAPQPGRQPSDLAGSDRPMSDDTQSGQPGTPGTGDVGMTEFAALDTNADGKLVEDEWRSVALDGTPFSEIDEDASGDIDREEYRQAKAMADDAAGSGETTQPN